MSTQPSHRPNPSHPSVAGAGRGAAFTALVAAALMAACGEESVTPPVFDPVGDIPLPALTDVDYGALGPHRIAFWRKSMTGTPGLYVVDGVSRTATSHLGGTLLTDPRVSPDGTQVAGRMLSLWGDTAWDVYVLGLGGRDRQLIAALDFNVEGAPAWAPDGSEVLFATLTSQPTEIVVRAHAPDGSRERVVLRLPEFSFFRPDVALSPDGTLAVASLDRVIVAPNEGAAETVYSPDAEGRSVEIAGIAWSPSGGVLALIEAQRIDGSYGEIRIRRIDGGVVSDPLATLPVAPPYVSFAPQREGLSVCWSRDASTLFFTASPGGGEVTHHVYAVAAEGGTPRKVTTAVGFADGSLSCL